MSDFGYGYISRSAKILYIRILRFYQDLFAIVKVLPTLTLHSAAYSGYVTTSSAISSQAVPPIRAGIVAVGGRFIGFG